MSTSVPSGHSHTATFESGARAMDAALHTGDVSAYFANAADPLHAAFAAKAVIHSGPVGMPLMGEAAEKKLESLWDEPRSGKSLAYIHVPFCETRCLYCMFYENPFKPEASHEFANRLIKELQLWSDKKAQTTGLIHALYFGGGTPTCLAPANLKRILSAVRLTCRLRTTAKSRLKAVSITLKTKRWKRRWKGASTASPWECRPSTAKCAGTCSRAEDARRRRRVRRGRRL